MGDITLVACGTALAIALVVWATLWCGWKCGDGSSNYSGEEGTSGTSRAGTPCAGTSTTHPGLGTATERTDDKDSSIAVGACARSQNARHSPVCFAGGSTALLAVVFAVLFGIFAGPSEPTERFRITI